MVERPRYDCDLRFPALAYVPGRSPHPRRGAEGLRGAACQPPVPERPSPQDLRLALRRGLDLFNHGYFWEAHEAWEDPWQREPRDSPLGLYLQALIRLAAAALKLRMDERRGVVAHAGWCADTLRRLQASHGDSLADGPRIDLLIALCERLRDAREALTDPEATDSPPRLATVLLLPTASSAP